MAMPVPEGLLKLLYFPPPPSLFVSAMSVVSFASLANAGFKEIRGKHMPYSKFAPTKAAAKLISSKTGMLILYIPAFLAGLASLALLPHHQSFRMLSLQYALTLHFFKRVLEVLFVHSYSGGMEVDAAIAISLSYFFSTATMIYAQHLSSGLPEPAIDLHYSGIALFLAGIIGNFYHHCILSKLRRQGDGKQYKIPTGGLFGLVICPHYLFEIMGFVGISCISQTLYASCFTLGTMFYLTGRSVATRRWYKSKFDDFPESIRALIPYVF